MAAEENVIRVNGSQLQAHMGKQVLLLGKGIQAGNMSLKMESSDGQVVEVKLLQQVMYSDVIEVVCVYPRKEVKVIAYFIQPDGDISCPIEVIGTVTGPRSIKALELSLYPDWQGVFDMETYSSILETIHSDKSLQEYVLGMH